MWPFFSNSYTSARINKVLVEIEMDQQPIPLRQQQTTTSSPPNTTATSTSPSLFQSSSPSEKLTSPAIHLLQSIQESQGKILNDDSDSDEEDRAINKDASVVGADVKKELNIDLLNKLLDQPNLVQEIQLAKNAKLLSYISQPDVLNVLIDYLIESVPSFEKLYYEEQDMTEGEDKTTEEVESIPVDSSDTDDTDGEAEVNRSEVNDNSNVDNRTNTEESSNDNDNDEEDEDDDVEKTDDDIEDELPYGKETQEQKYRRRASTAGEILSVLDPPIISQRLLLPITDKDAIKSNEVAHFELLGKLWTGILSLDFPVENIINLSLFVKTIENLINLNANEFMNFIRQYPEDHLLVDDILRHAGTPQLMELLIKIISMDKIDHPIGLIEILHEQDLIVKLVKLLDSEDLLLQNSVGDFLTNLVSISANTPSLFDSEADNITSQMDSPIIGPNELTRSLVSKDCISILIDIIMKGGSSLPTCVSLIIEIIRKNNSDYDLIDLMDDDYGTNPPDSREPIFIGTMLKIFSEKLVKIFNRFFDDNYSVPPIETTLGSQEPVGFERFKIIELIAELLHCSNMLLVNNRDAENAVERRNSYKKLKFDLMHEALLDSIMGDLEKDSTSVMNERSYSSETKQSESFPGAGGLGGGDGSTSLVDIEKLTNDIKNFCINNLPQDENVDTKHSDTEQDEPLDEVKPDDMSIGDFFKLQLLKGDMLIKIFSMLDRFPWNNFLHNVIFDIGQQVLNGRYDEMNFNRKLIMELFDVDRCNLTEYIIACYDKSEEKERTDHLRLGYMGHLILISEELVKFSGKVYAAVEEEDILFEGSEVPESLTKEMIEINNKIHEVISEKNWLDFVHRELATIRDMYNQVLGGVRPDENDTYLNPSTILLGNGEEDEDITPNEEAIEDFETDAVADPEIEYGDIDKDIVNLNANGSLELEVIESQEKSSATEEESEKEQFGGDLCPVLKHNSNGDDLFEDDDEDNENDD